MWPFASVSHMRFAVILIAFDWFAGERAPLGGLS